MTPEQAGKVAELARLRLSEVEAAACAEQLTKLVRYFEELRELDTGAIEPTSHGVPMACPLREDRLETSALSEAIMDRAPRREQGHFVVPRVIG